MSDLNLCNIYIRQNDSLFSMAYIGWAALMYVSHIDSFLLIVLAQIMFALLGQLSVTQEWRWLRW